MDRDRSERPRLLVVDDDDDMCDLLRSVLSEHGYAVATVPHGAAALELVKRHQPQVILLDLRMPIMDGWAFAAQYRRLAQPPAAIVVMSAVRDARQQALALGAEGYIQKPFGIDELLAVLTPICPPNGTRRRP